MTEREKVALLYGPYTAPDLKIGDRVTIQGPQGADGTYQAQQVTIGGAAGTGRGSGGGGGATGGSAVPGG